jgi:hypothetical protein
MHKGYFPSLRYITLFSNPLSYPISSLFIFLLTSISNLFVVLYMYFKTQFDISAGGSFFRPVVSVSDLTWCIIYI